MDVRGTTDDRSALVGSFSSAASNNLYGGFLAINSAGNGMYFTVGDVSYTPATYYAKAVWGTIAGSGNVGLRFGTNARSDDMVISTSGNVGIGTTAPTEKLEVSGNIKASGTVSQGSSKEFKKNIAYVSTKDAVHALNKLNPVRFEYKTDKSGEKHLGFIAEDVPDFVAEQDRKHLNAMDITAVLTKVVQEQQRQIQEQQR